MQRKNLLLAGALSSALLALPLAGTGHAADTGSSVKTQSSTDSTFRSDDATRDRHDMTSQQRAQAQRDKKAAKAEDQYEKKVDKAQDKTAKAADQRDKKLGKAQDQYERKTGDEAPLTTGRSTTGSGSSAVTPASSGAGSSDVTASPGVKSDPRIGTGSLDNNRVTR